MPRCTEFHLWSKEWLWKKLFESHYRFGDIGVCQHLIRDVTFFPGIDDKGFIDCLELGDQQVKRVPQSLKGIVGRRNRDLQVVALWSQVATPDGCWQPWQQWLLSYLAW